MRCTKVHTCGVPGTVHTVCTCSCSVGCAEHHGVERATRNYVQTDVIFSTSSLVPFLRKEDVRKYRVKQASREFDASLLSFPALCLQSVCQFIFFVVTLTSSSDVSITNTEQSITSTHYLDLSYVTRSQWLVQTMTAAAWSGTATHCSLSSGYHVSIASLPEEIGVPYRRDVSRIHVRWPSFTNMLQTIHVCTKFCAFLPWKWTSTAILDTFWNKSR